MLFRSVVAPIPGQIPPPSNPTTSPPNQIPPPSNPNPPTTPYIWQWQSDNGYVSYNSTDNDTIEKDYQAMLQNSTILINGANYMINFATSKQVNTTNGKVRNIQRLFNGIKDSLFVPKPTTVIWECQTDRGVVTWL